MAQEFTLEEKTFLGDTSYRWIGIGIVSYDDVDLNEDLKSKLKERGFTIKRKGVKTTVYEKPN